MIKIYKMTRYRNDFHTTLGYGYFVDICLAIRAAEEYVIALRKHYGVVDTELMWRDANSDGRYIKIRDNDYIQLRECVLETDMENVSRNVERLTDR